MISYPSPATAEQLWIHTTSLDLDMSRASLISERWEFAQFERFLMCIGRAMYLLNLLREDYRDSQHVLAGMTVHSKKMAEWFSNLIDGNDPHYGHIGYDSRRIENPFLYSDVLDISYPAPNNAIVYVMICNLTEEQKKWAADRGHCCCFADQTFLNCYHLELLRADRTSVLRG